ncbi:MAG: zinc-dependent alcohol dehydrogenase family protein [Candidatus Hadarchaeales archaeon]
MKALVYHAPERFSIEEVPTPHPVGREVLIRVRCCGICKTDVHIHRGRFISKFPLTPGHEFAGEVAEVGEEVTAFKPGDRVTADNTELCGSCYFCRRNQPLFCENFLSHGCNAPGGFAEYVLIKEEKVFRLPDHLSFEEASFTEPTACVVHALDVARVEPASEVLVFGAGPAGLVLAQALKATGVSRLVVAAPNEFKLELAKELAADEVVKIDKRDPSVGREELLRICPKGFDAIFEATGAPEVVERSIQLAKNGGKVVIFGVAPEEAKITVSPYEIYKREIKLIGTFAQTHCFDRALQLLSTGKVKVKKLITHEFRLEDYGRALETLLAGGNVLKVLIKP